MRCWFKSIFNVIAKAGPEILVPVATVLFCVLLILAFSFYWIAVIVAWGGALFMALGVVVLIARFVRAVRVEHARNCRKPV